MRSSKIILFQLISAQQLPKPEGSVSKIDTVDPYIVVRIIGIPQDSHEYRTYAVKNDGTWSPVLLINLIFYVLITVTYVNVRSECQGSFGA